VQPWPRLLKTNSTDNRNQDHGAADHDSQGHRRAPSSGYHAGSTILLSFLSLSTICLNRNSVGFKNEIYISLNDHIKM